MNREGDPQPKSLNPEPDAPEYSAVPRRIDGPKSAYAFHQSVVKANDAREQRRRRVLHINGGYPPVPKSRLKKSGELWRANFSLRDHPSKCGEIATVFYDLLEDVPQLARFENTFSTDLETSYRYGAIIAEKFHRLLTIHWEGFFDEAEAGINELVLFDIMPLVHTDPVSFYISHLKANSLLLPEGARSNMDRWEYFEFRHSYGVYELWSRISTPEKRKAAEKAGWNPKGVLAAIEKAMKLSSVSDRYQVGNFSSMEIMMQNNDLYMSEVKAETVDCAVQLVREMDGKVRRSVIMDSCALNEYLYDKVESFESFRDFLSVIYYSTNSFFHSRRGVGELIFDLCYYSDILGMDMIDSARLGSMFWFKGARASNRPKAWQKLAFVDDDLELVGNRASIQMEGSFAASRLVQQKLGNVANVDVGSAATDSVQPESARGRSLRALKHIELRRSNILRFYRGMDRVYQSMFKRLTTGAWTKDTPGYRERELFLEEIRLAGVPREALNPKYNTVTAVRSIGSGSRDAFERGATTLAALAPAMKDESKRQKAYHLRAAADTDFRTAQEFFPVGVRDLSDTAENTLISLEVSHLRAGEGVAVEENQRHTKHILAIFTMLEQVLQSEQDPLKAYETMSVSMTNVASRMQYMAGNPTYSQDLATIRPAFEEKFAQFQQLKATANAAAEARAARIREVQERLAEAERNKVDPDVLKVMKDHEVDLMDVQSQHAVRMQKVQNQHTEKMASAALDART